MTHYLQAFKPREIDPLSVLVAREEALLGYGSITTKKSKEKVGLSPAAFRVLQRYGDDVIVSSERMHFVGDTCF